MKLIDLFHIERTDEPVAAEEPPSAEEALAAAFALLTGNDPAVADRLNDCVTDTEKYYSGRSDILERRGLKYSDEARPWLCVIAAVEAAMEKGYLRELHVGCSADDFSKALNSLLDAAGIVFSTQKIRFDPRKGLEAWSGLFNEYAGQSGITLCFIDLYGDSRVMGVARIADYAEAAETAGYAGVTITSRPC